MVLKDLMPAVVVQETLRNQITLVVEEVFHCQWLQHGHNNYC